MSLIRILHMEDICVVIVSHLGGIREILSLDKVCKEIHNKILCNDLIWRFVYEMLYPRVDSFCFLDEVSQRQVNRPHRENCIGWTVRVLQEGDVENNNIEWRGGIVTNFKDFPSEQYEVDYGNERVWETAHRENVRHHMLGLSRFDFMLPPVHVERSLGNEAAASSPMNQTSMHTSDFISWRHECCKLHTHIPTTCSATLNQHTDEILHLEFSNNGRYLVACSRDGSFSLTEFIWSGSQWSIGTSIKRSVHNSLPACKVMWSQDDTYFCVILEADPAGSPNGVVEIVKLSQKTVSIDLTTQLVRYIYPFDFFVVWLNDHCFIRSCHVDFGTEQRFQQTLRLHSFDNEVDDSITLLCTHSNYARTAVVIRTQSEESADVKEVLVFMCGDNPYITNSLYFLDLEEATQHDTPIDINSLPSIDTAGAIISIHANRSAHCHNYILVNVRPFVHETDYLKFKDFRNAQSFNEPIPDIENSVELRVYSIKDRTLLSVMKGHHAFTLKNSIFFLYLDSALLKIYGEKSTNSDFHAVDTCDLIASGSEDSNIYIWYRSQRRLIKVLRGHTDTASTVSFNPCIRGVLASGADDNTIKIWCSDDKVLKESGRRRVKAQRLVRTPI